MAKSRKGRSSIHLTATAPRLVGLSRPVRLADLVLCTKPTSDLESFLSRDPAADPKSRTPAPQRFP